MTEKPDVAAPPPPISDDPPPTPTVEVDLDSGKVIDAAPEPETAPEAKSEPEQKRPAIPRPQQRIQALTHERDAERTARERLERELADARREAAEAKLARDSAERVGMENHLARTKSEVAAAKLAVKAAKEANDADAEIEAQARLAKAAAEEADADAWVAANPKREPPVFQPQPQRQQPQAVPPVPGNVLDFINENPWYSAVQMGSDGRPVIDPASGRPVSNPDFDPDMHDVATLEDRKIQREIRLGVLPAKFMGSPEYFARITERVQSEFADAFESVQEPEPPPPPQRGKTPNMSHGKQPVAPSSRHVPGTPPARSTEKMRLNGEEVDMVRSLVDNGTLLYPRNHPDPNKRGQRMSYDDAYHRFATEKKSDLANRPQQQQ